MTSLPTSTFVVFDLETTGLYPEKGARICEIGAVRYENGQEVDRFNSMVNPQVPIEPEASRVNGIYDIDVAMAPSIEEVIDDFINFIGDSPLFGYKISFDLGFIEADLKRLNYPELTNQYFDVLLMARSALKALTAYNLGFVADNFNIDKGKSHRATDDARTTAEVFLALLPGLEAKGIDNFEKLYHHYGYCPKSSCVTEGSWTSMIQTAISTKARLSIEYKSKKGEVTSRELLPYRLEKRGYEYYLIAKCILRNDMRSFNLNQIVSCRLLSS